MKDGTRLVVVRDGRHIKVESFATSSPENIKKEAAHEFGADNLIFIGGEVPAPAESALTRLLTALDEITRPELGGKCLAEVFDAYLNTGAQAVLNAIRSGRLTVDEIKRSEPPAKPDK